MIKKYTPKLKIEVVLIPLIILLSSCTSLHQVSLKEPISDRVRIDDKILFTTKDNRQGKLTVSDITSSKVMGDNKSINISNIKELQKRELSPWKNGLLVGIVGSVTIYPILGAGLYVNPMFGLLAFGGSYAAIKLYNSSPTIDNKIDEWH